VRLAGPLLVDELFERDLNELKARLDVSPNALVGEVLGLELIAIPRWCGSMPLKHSTNDTCCEIQDQIHAFPREPDIPSRGIVLRNKGLFRFPSARRSTIRFHAARILLV
jgi:hypothetical protein